MMKIVLVQPPLPPRRGVQAELHWPAIPPFSLLYLAAALRKWTNWEVQITDFASALWQSELGELEELVRMAKIRQVLSNTNASVFGITSTTYTRHEAAALARVVKEVYPHAIVVVGGPHFTHITQETLSKIPDIDAVVRGEGELVIAELVASVQETGRLDQVRGITYRRGHEIVNNPSGRVLKDLDDLDIWEGFSYEKDDYPHHVFDYPERIPAISIPASRGCPHQCVFCSGGRANCRIRNPKRVVDEIEMLTRKFGIRGVNFIDPAFTLVPKHVVALCEEIIARKIEIHWWCEGRADAPLELLPLMRRAGCVAMGVGCESGSPRILAKLGKRISKEQIIAFCRKCKEVGIRITCYFMFSLPGENEQDLQETIDFITTLEEYGASCVIQPCMIFPGTELERIGRERGILPPSFSWCEPFDCELNVELGQLPNCPIYVEKLSQRTLRSVQARLQSERIARRLVREGWLHIGASTLSVLFRRPRLLFGHSSRRWLALLIANKLRLERRPDLQGIHDGE